jgi:hypothetical protein
MDELFSYDIYRSVNGNVNRREKGSGSSSKLEVDEYLQQRYAAGPPGGNQYFDNNTYIGEYAVVVQQKYPQQQQKYPQQQQQQQLSRYPIPTAPPQEQRVAQAPAQQSEDLYYIYDDEDVGTSAGNQYEDDIGIHSLLCSYIYIRYFARTFVVSSTFFDTLFFCFDVPRGVRRILTGIVSSTLQLVHD